MSKLQECAFSATTSPSRDIPVYIYATAGMRVLNKQDQNRIYNAIYLAYLRSDLHFYMRRDMLQTIDRTIIANPHILSTIPKVSDVFVDAFIQKSRDIAAPKKRRTLYREFLLRIYKVYTGAA